MKIKEIVDIATGYQVRSRLSSGAEGSHKFIQMRNVSDDSGQLLINSCFNLVTPTEKQAAKFELIGGDILIQTKGRYNWATLITEDEKDFVASGQFSILRISSDISCSSEYLCWVLNRLETQSHFKRMQCGTSIAILTNENIGNYSIELPTMAVQLKIVKFDRLAKNEQKLLKKLSDQRKLLTDAVCYKLLKNINRV